MSDFIAQCSSGMLQNYPLWVAIALAGLVGGLTHCSLMCAPMVASQMLMMRRQNWLMGLYHLGRATTYVMLGLLSFYASHWLFGSQGEAWRALLLLLSGSVFVLSAVLPKKTHGACESRFTSMNAAIHRLQSARWQFYLRGALMGLMPCGMLLSVLLLVATVHQPVSAVALMLLFALSTTPVLQLAGFALSRSCGSHPARRKALGRAAMGLNGLYICYLGMNPAVYG